MTPVNIPGYDTVLNNKMDINKCSPVKFVFFSSTSEVGLWCFVLDTVIILWSNKKMWLHNLRKSDVIIDILKSLD